MRAIHVFSVAAAATAVFYALRSPGKPLSATPSFTPVECSAALLEAAGRCAPAACGRAVERGFLSRAESAELRALLDHALAEPGMGGAGPVSVLDMASGALSRGEQFVDGFRALKASGRPLPERGVRLYAEVRDRVRERVRETFFAGARAPLSHAAPSFFSRIDATDARTQHDEYWHEHVDAVQYGSFVFTALLYLADGDGAEFSGGDFVFDSEPAASLTPEVGTLSYFSSGHENVHHVARVTGGVRYALTIAFACEGEDEEGAA